jgi:hypothetical protein
MGALPVSTLSPRIRVVASVLAAAVAAASMWFYVDAILRAHQIAEAQARQIPRGNLSDLYPRWLGARELLLRHRNPYSREVTLEIQEEYYGRRLDAARPNDPKDQEGFAYPAYVVFLLAPLIGLPFSLVQTFFYWLLIGLTAASVLLWLRVLRSKLATPWIAVCILVTLGSFAVVQGIKLQQLSLLVAALMAAATACVAGGFLFSGGVLLALATIKPQLAWALTAWLLLWALSDWRKRRRFVFGLAGMMGLLLAGSEIVLPGWWRMFAAAIGEYHHYTQNQSVIEVTLSELLGVASTGAAHLGAQVLAVLAVIVCGVMLWRLRRADAGDSKFSYGTALVLAVTVLVVPMYAPYNQVLLLPAILILLGDRTTFVSTSPFRRLAFWAGVFLVAWQWAGSLSLTAIYFLISKEVALDGWTLPFFATFALPVWIFVLIFLDVRGKVQREQGMPSVKVR